MRRERHFPWKGKRFLLFALFAVFGVVVPAVAQPPRLDFRRIDAFQFPDITLYVSVKCNGEARFNLTRDNFTIKENGKIITDFEVICPDPLVHCCISVALVFDRSGSMNGNGIQQEKHAGKVFVDMMDGLCDEATVVSFASNVTVDVFMTNDKDLLKAGIDGMVASGATALWDGAGTGVMELINNGVNECRAVIVLTDGGENSSTQYTLDDVIALAQANKIRVFTIGLGNGVVEPPLQQLARETGGVYYHAPSGDQLEAIYREISTIISQYFQECQIIYKSNCPDGSTRTIEVTVGSPVPIGPDPRLKQGPCPGTDTKVKIYKAPFDPSQFKDINIKLGEVDVLGGEEVEVPLILEDYIDDYFNKATFKVMFD
ncbi:MAG: VWA domain-containing protein, partial [Chlorobi bacterium]|nr:VWA domain-containing protein [Chlorobiota bacterium]